MPKQIDNIAIADTLWKKIVGVMFWHDFRGYNGLLLPKTNSIHTFFVRFSLDIVFLDEDNKVIRLVENLKPWWFSPIVWNADATLELPARTIARYSLAVGDKLVLQ